MPAYNTYGVQVPVNQMGAWQPNFQCADFMARALTQNGLVLGLNKGSRRENALLASHWRRR